MFIHLAYNQLSNKQLLQWKKNWQSKYDEMRRKQRAVYEADTTSVVEVDGALTINNTLHNQDPSDYSLESPPSGHEDSNMHAKISTLCMCSNCGSIMTSTHLCHDENSD